MARVRGRRRVVVDHRRAMAGRAVGARAAHGEPIGRNTPADRAGYPCRQHDQGKRDTSRKGGDEGRRGDRPQHSVAQRPRADAVCRMQHDRRHRRLDAVEHARHQWRLAEREVDPRQGDEDQQRRQHEERPGHDAAPGAVQQPADVGRELLRLRSRQHHAVVERVQEASLRDPAPALDQLLVHHRDLAGRSAEADEAELEPEAERVAKARDGRRVCRGGRIRHGGDYRARRPAKGHHAGTAFPFDERTAMTDARPDGALDIAVVPRTHDLGDRFEVRRALPSVQRRMVGPFVFLDQMGPVAFAPGTGVDVRPHPHIGLATVTYLLDGEIVHRDSLGSVQTIRPGEVNWMTAGRGIVHSERTGPDARAAGSSLWGLQSWVALPQRDEEGEPGFVHVGADALPVEADQGVVARVVAGEFLGRRAPVPVRWPLFYVDVQLAPGARLAMRADYPEQAIYLVDGTLDLGPDGSFDVPQLLVLRPGASVTLAAVGTSSMRAMLLGGEPMDGPRYLAWNFVASSPERLEQAKDDWRHGRFAPVPGETEFIPLPDIPGKPVHYP
jgi:redox-sensitive bicupin YhaK (pirin superfamily)